MRHFFWTQQTKSLKMVCVLDSLEFVYDTNCLDVSNSSFVQFQIWDFTGQIDFFDTTFDADMIFSGCGALIFVIDAQVCTQMLLAV